MGSAESALPSIIFLILVTSYVILIGFILTWIYFDAEQRGIMGWVVVPLVFFTGSSIFGAIMWLIFRPKLKPQYIKISERP